MPAASTILSCTGLLVSGLAWCALSHSRLMGNPQLATPLNPFGINRSPYGEVLAMAMQGPINTDFHLALFGISPDDGDGHSHGDHPPAASSPATLAGLIARMQQGHSARTNPLPPNRTLQFHLRREAEDKLRFAYQLDPAHYANYNALHFFLTEGITTRPELAATATSLGRETIAYCQTQLDDPRPALTAGSACFNILLVMFMDQNHGHRHHPVAEMDAYLDQLDASIARYEHLAAEWDRRGQWNLISPARAQECADRLQLLKVSREVAFKTIQRLKKS